MTIEKKLLGTSPSGGATDVADVFSTGLHQGNGTNTAINNGIDLAGEGGMVWVKSRSAAENHAILDSERTSVNHMISSNTTAAQNADTGNPFMVSFNSNGYTLGVNGLTNASLGGSGYVAWTFRKAKKFFDIVTWSGNNSTNRQIPHSIAGPVGMILLKCTSAATNWNVFHTSLGNTKRMLLNRNDIAVQTAQEYWNNTSPTSANFTVGGSGDNNSTGRTYVAYVFADNSSEDAEEQMIKCGSYVGNQNATGPVVNLGWEPQWLMVKQTNLIVDPADWIMVDNMRGWATGASDARLYANTAGAENSTEIGIDITSTGFKLTTNGEQTNKNNATYIYMAIRAPMMKEPEAATEVFAVAARTGASGSTPSWVSGFVTDMTIQIEAGSSNHTVGTRLLGDNVIYTDTNNLASGGGGKYTWDYMTGFSSGTGAAAANKELMWKRAKGYMDCVAYIGTGSNTPHSHSLAAVPEMMWLKPRDANGQGGHNWLCWHKAMPINTYMMLNYDNAQAAFNWSNETLPTKTGFTVKSNVQSVNQATKLYMAYLFSTLAGISKCGSYTGNGSYQTISCGFSAGSRFVLIKRTDASGDWYVWDSLNGIVAGNSPHSSLNTSAAQVTNDDSIDPANAGFIVNQVAATNINVSSGTYIFYAIA